MRCLNAPFSGAECPPIPGRRRHLDRSRVSSLIVRRVASERSDASAASGPISTSGGSGSERGAAGFVASAQPSVTGGSSSNSSHVASATAAGVAGFSAATQHLNVVEGLPGSTLPIASASAEQPPRNGFASQQQWMGDASSSASSSSSSGYGGGGSYQQQQQGVAWQPPNYRRSGLRLRSKRGLQAAEQLQRSGRNLIVEELQSFLGSSSRDSAGSADAAAAGGESGSSTSSAATSTSGTADGPQDQHLEAFIDQMLSPAKSGGWARSDTAAAASAKTDGREAIDPAVLANIHSLPVNQVAQHQMQLAQRGQLLAALLLLEEAVAAGRRDVLMYTHHKSFLRAAGKARNTAAVLRFLQLLPAEFAHAPTYNLALKACAAARDLRAALRVVDIMGIRQVPTDFMHFTTLIAVCASAGDANQAFAVFQKAKAAQQQLAAAASAAVAAAGGDSRQQAAAAKAAPRMDGHVYGALIAACAQAIRNRSSDLREQLVILERAFQVLHEAEDAGVYLDTPVWNALLMCAGRCRQLQRCFEVLDRMTAAGVPSNSITYTCLIEAAVLSGDVDMAQRVFARAMATGVTNSVQLYTAAINACMTDEHTNFEAAFDIYTTMQRHGVEPDNLLYGHLIAIAGRCRKLEVAFDLLEEMRASGLTPSTPTCSALIYACLQNNNFAAARKVYDTLIARGVPPHISQYNSLMEQYALRFQLGNVVSVLTSMVAGGVQPNANTFRILLLACQRTDQAELAFELYQVMKARGLQPRLNNAHSICYTLLNTCFSRIRKGWWPGGYPPKPKASMGPYSNLPGLRPAEARQLLHVLQPGAFQGSAAGNSSSSGGSGGSGSGSGSGTSSSGSGAAAGSGGRQQQGRRFTFLDNADNINWPVLALSTYRDFISWGYKPHLEVLDKLLACLRLQLPKAPQRPAELQQRALQLQAQLQALPHPDAPAHMGTASPAAASPSSAGGSSDAPDGQAASASSSRVARQQQQQEQPGQWLQTAALLKDLASQRHAQSPDERPYEVPFDKRAIDAVADAISMGLLPALKLDAPVTVDMRCFPPCVAEAYVHMLMSTLESRAATAAAEGKRQPVAQRVRLIVPPFDHNYVMWPSYVEKLYVHYNEQLLARQAQLRAEAMAARARAAALAAQSMSGDDEDEDMGNDQLLLSFGANSAAAGPGAGAGLPSAAAFAAGRGGRRAGSMLRSFEVADLGDDVAGADFTGYTAALASSQPGVATAIHGRYIAGAVTGLAAAATFRRLKAYTRVDSASGTIKLEPQEVNRWLNAKLRYEEERRRIAREAEIAAAGFSSALPYYQQQQQQAFVQQQQQQGWSAAGPSWQQPQQQQQQDPQQQAAAQHGGSGTLQGSAGLEQQQQQSQQPQQQQSHLQQQQPLVPGFSLQGPAGASRSGLQQQLRNIRLGMAPAAAANLKRPGQAATEQQQAAAAAGGWTAPQPAGQQQQQPNHAGPADQSSGGNNGGSGSSSGKSRSRRAHKSATAAAAAAAAAASVDDVLLSPGSSVEQP